MVQQANSIMYFHNTRCYHHDHASELEVCVCPYNKERFCICTVKEVFGQEIINLVNVNIVECENLINFHTIITHLLNIESHLIDTL